METIKPTFKYNDCGVKSSCDQYRNIKGVHYICWTSDPGMFDEEKEWAKKECLRTKMIKGELYVEKK